MFLLQDWAIVLYNYYGAYEIILYEIAQNKLENNMQTCCNLNLQVPIDYFLKLVLIYG